MPLAQWREGRTEGLRTELRLPGGTRTWSSGALNQEQGCEVLDVLIGRSSNVERKMSNHILAIHRF